LSTDAIELPTTVVLGETTPDYLFLGSVDFSILNFAHTIKQLSSLSMGDVIISAASEIKHYGLLREVTNVIFNVYQVVVEVAQTALEHAIRDCIIDNTSHLQPDGSFILLKAQEIAIENALSIEMCNILASSTEASDTGF